MDTSLEYKLDVMQKALSGSNIEFKLKTEEDRKYSHICHPSWNWDKYDYRVKKETKIIPYKSYEELEKGIKEHKGIVISKSGSHGRYRILAWYYSVSNILCIILGNLSIPLNMENFLKDYTWLDGAPCGTTIET